MLKKIEIMQYEKKIKWICHSLKIFSHNVSWYSIIYTCGINTYDETTYETKRKSEREAQYGVVGAIDIVISCCRRCLFC